MRAEADFEATQMAMEGVRNEDNKLLVKFYTAPLQNQNKSLEAGRPIYEDKEMIRIMVPGDKDNIIDREASDMDKRRFAASYAAFKQGHAEQLIGTPLEVWPMITRAIVEELRYFNVRTVEQLADLRDDVAMRMMNGLAIKAQAATFLQAAKDNAPLVKMTEELKSRDAEIAQLKAQNAAINARLDQMTVEK